MFAHRSAVRRTAVRVTSTVEEGCDWFVAFLAPAMSTLMTLAYVVGLVALALAVTDDMNDRDRRGGVWGVLVLLTHGLVAVLWMLQADERTG